MLQAIYPKQEARRLLPPNIKNMKLTKKDGGLLKTAQKALNYVTLKRISEKKPYNELSLETLSFVSLAQDVLDKAINNVDGQIINAIENVVSENIVESVIAEDSDPLIEWLESESSDPRLEHKQYYGEVMHLSKAKQLGLGAYNCQCGFLIIKQE
ncbi:hypothetical protein EBU95_21655 [bacterium]|nr:hypothetical protein [bacterium]